MNADEIIKTYEIEKEKNYLLIVKVKNLSNADSIGGLDRAVAAINDQLKTNIIALVVSEENEFRLINIDDMSIEEAITNMGLVKRELKPDEEDL